MESYVSIQQLDPMDDKQTNLIKCFQTKYNKNAKFIVKVPGRVNLVGEHVDYSGFPVISMAIEQNISIAANYYQNSKNQFNEFAKLNFNEINLSNKDQNNYQDFIFNDTISLDNLIDKPNWYHYVICGYKGIIEDYEQYFKNENSFESIKKLLNSFKIDLMIDGDIPPGSGLSSSSALVVGSSIAFRYCLGLILKENIKSIECDDQFQNELNKILKIQKNEMANNCAMYERFIGTNGGGIDQAIQMLAEHKTAKLIKFKPKLEAFNVELPKDCEFFVIHCGKTLNKASTIHYNVRVFETRVAAILLKQYRSKTTNDQQSIDEINKDKVLLSDFETKNHENPYYDLIEQVTNLFANSKGRFTIKEIQKLLEVDSYEKLCEKIDFPLKSINLIVDSNGEQFKFNLLNRALHVYQEVNRVLKMQSIDPNEKNEIKLNLVGKLLNESHQSLKELYECSCDELDRLIELSNQNGHSGAKLTGAGWAGCLVSCVPSNKVEEYEKNLSSQCKFMIKTKPNHGSMIYRI